ncbi:MAG: ABC transporter permease subunit [Acidimicrobiia bacterium]
METVQEHQPKARERTEARVVRVLAFKELHDALRDRWLWLYAGAFAVLATSISSISASNTSTIGFTGFGRTASSLVALAQMVVPLMGLTIGARSVAGQRERGTLTFLLSHPVNATEVYLGIFLGNVVSLLAAVSAGFGIAGGVSALRGAPVDGVELVWLALLAWLLAVSMVGVGMVVSTISSRSATAMGLALVLWLAFVLLGNLGLMGTATATRMGEGSLFMAAVANPVEAFRLSAMTMLDGSLDVLGPIGNYAVDRFGDRVSWVTGGSLAIWTIIPALVGGVVFTRRAER